MDVWVCVCVCVCVDGGVVKYIIYPHFVKKINNYSGWINSTLKKIYINEIRACDLLNDISAYFKLQLKSYMIGIF